MPREPSERRFRPSRLESQGRDIIFDCLRLPFIGPFSVFSRGGGRVTERTAGQLPLPLQPAVTQYVVDHNGLVRKPRSGPENGQLADEINDDIADRRNGRGST